MMLKAVFVLVCVRYATSTAGPFNCVNMRPTFIQGGPETGSSPYDVSVVVETCNPEATVTLNGTAAFIGFLCQARPTGQDMPLTSGTFTPIGSGMTNNCSTMTSLNHDSFDSKTSIQFKWEPAGNETVRIVCTVVRNMNKYWTRQRSDIIELDLNDPSCTTTTVSTTTESSSARGVVPATFAAMLLLIIVSVVITPE